MVVSSGTSVAGCETTTKLQHFSMPRLKRAFRNIVKIRILSGGTTECTPAENRKVLMPVRNELLISALDLDNKKTREVEILLTLTVLDGKRHTVNPGSSPERIVKKQVTPREQHLSTGK